MGTERESVSFRMSGSFINTHKAAARSRQMAEDQEVGSRAEPGNGGVKWVELRQAQAAGVSILGHASVESVP